MRKIKILVEFKNKQGVDCITISKTDYNFLYDMSDLLMNIESDIFNIRGILEKKRDVFQKREKQEQTK